MYLSKINEDWIPLQNRVFSRWVQTQLNGHSDVQVNDVSKDLSDGVALCQLAEILTKKQAPHGWCHKPKYAFDRVTNCDLALEMFEKDGVHFINISGKDVCDNNEKLILGLIWTLILHYSVGGSLALTQNQTQPAQKATTSEKDNTHALMTWAIERTSNYQHADNFQSYDMSMAALLNSYAPERINYSQLDPKDTKKNTEIVTNVMKDMGIPVLIQPEDVEQHNNRLDSKTLMTQLSSAKFVLDSESFQSDESLFSSQQRITNAANTSSSPLTGTTERKVTETSSTNTFESFDGDNSQYAGKKFALTMTLKGSEYNGGNTVEPNCSTSGPEVTMALTFLKNDPAFINPSGKKLDLQEANIQNDPCQQFTFGQNDWNTVIDSYAQQGMVWDVADQDNLNPPEGTPFYLFPFHGRHNQHFVYVNEKIYAKQNGQVVTYVGGEKPFVMMKPTDSLRNRQTFRIQLL